MTDPSRNNASLTPGRGPGRPFDKGNSGRPKGARNKVTQAVEALLEGEAEGIGRKCIEMALNGDSTAMRLNGADRARTPCPSLLHAPADRDGSRLAKGGGDIARGHRGGDAVSGGRLGHRQHDRLAVQD